MIVLSLLLVLTSAGLLLAGMVMWLDGASAAHTEPLVWASLAVGALAVLVVALSVARRRGSAAELAADADNPADPGVPRGADPGDGGAGWTPGQPLGQPLGWRPETPQQPAGPPPHERAGRPDDRPTAGGSTEDAPDATPPAPLDEPAAEVPDPADVAGLDQAGGDRVAVVDGRPRYHLADCPHLAGRATVEVERGEARAAGFTPCGRCCPERELARRRRG